MTNRREPGRLSCVGPLLFHCLPYYQLDLGLSILRYRLVCSNKILVQFSQCDIFLLLFLNIFVYDSLYWTCFLLTLCSGIFTTDNQHGIFAKISFQNSYWQFFIHLKQPALNTIFVNNPSRLKLV